MTSLMFCVDTTDYMRNGDYFPNRSTEQQTAVNLIMRNYLRQSAMNEAGLVTMVDNNVSLHLSSDSHKMQAYLNNIHPQPSTCIHFSRSIAAANLALKHRQNKNYQSRIVLFVGSPIVNAEIGAIRLKDVEERRKQGTQVSSLTDEDVHRDALTNTKSSVINIAKRLKKEKTHIDVICMGENDKNEELLADFIGIMGSELGRLVSVLPGSSVTDAISMTLFGMSSESGMATMMEEDDPELAMVLRLSMEEAGVAAVQQLQNEQAATGPAPMDTSEPATSERTPPVVSDESDFMNLTEDEQLALAMRLSLESAAQEQQQQQPEQQQHGQEPEQQQREQQQQQHGQEQGQKQGEQQQHGQEQGQQQGEQQQHGQEPEQQQGEHKQQGPQTEQQQAEQQHGQQQDPPGEDRDKDESME